MGNVGVQAYAALILWIPICFALFGTMKPLKAAFVALVVGVMVLPERAMFDPPALPPFDKQGFACLAAYFGSIVFLRDKMRRAKTFGGSERFFLIVIIGNFGTALTNPDPIVIGGGLGYDGVPTPQFVLQGLTYYDIPSMIVRDALGILLPFHLGRALVRDREEAVVMWTVVVGTMLALLLPMLLELRISPQLHRWVYGAHASDFAHAMRGGGFKSTLFLISGLALAMFLLTAIFGATLLKREGQKVAGLSGGTMVWGLWGVLLISRNAASNFYALASIPLVLKRDTSSAARLSVILALLVVTYPSLRATQIFPARELVEFAAKYSVNRAESLAFRFDNEDILIERASPRKWFGWGGFNRNRIYDIRGKEVSVTDGEWIIRYGIRGTVGFVGSFGLLVWPVFAAFRRRRKLRDPGTVALVDTMALLVAVSAVDMLPNGFFTVLPYFFAGALAGVTEGGVGPAGGAGPPPRPEPLPDPRLDPQLDPRWAPPVGLTGAPPYGYDPARDPRMGAP
jgi:hypothetical protein